MPFTRCVKLRRRRRSIRKVNRIIFKEQGEFEDDESNSNRTLLSLLGELADFISSFRTFTNLGADCLGREATMHAYT